MTRGEWVKAAGLQPVKYCHKTTQNFADYNGARSLLDVAAELCRLQSQRLTPLASMHYQNDKTACKEFLCPAASAGHWMPEILPEVMPGLCYRPTSRSHTDNLMGCTLRQRFTWLRSAARHDWSICPRKKTEVPQKKQKGLRSRAWE